MAAASVKVLEESATPDVQCSIAPGSFKDGQIGALDEFPGITAGAWQMRPQSRGYVEAKSPFPNIAPAINPRYLSEETDRRAIVGGLKFIRRLFAAPALAKYLGPELLPGAQVASDDELLDYARQKGSTVYHATCSCKMGSDQMAVVDDQLRVHGLGAVAGHRRLGDADRDLDQHQRADDHDRRARRRIDPPRRPRDRRAHCPRRLTSGPFRNTAAAKFPYNREETGKLSRRTRFLGQQTPAISECYLQRRGQVNREIFAT